MSSKVQTDHDDKVASKQPLSKPPVRETAAIKEHTHPATVLQRAMSDPRSLTQRDVLQLQRAIGNQAVQQLLLQAKRDGLEARSSTKEITPLHTKPLLNIQAKLRVNTPEDTYEEEADRIADRVMLMPEPGLQPPSQMEKSGQQHERMQTKSVKSSQSAQIAAPPIVDEVLNSSGQPLDSATRDFMEPRFGHDFNQVRVHTHTKAAESAQGLNAHAYTVGNDIVFGAGQYAPGTTTGNRLLAHELTHVVQQTGAIQRQPAPDTVDEISEEDAAYVAKSVKEDFYDFYNKLSRAQFGSHAYSPFRQQLIQELDAINIADEIAEGIFDDPLSYLGDIYEIGEKIAEVKIKLEGENGRAMKRWAAFQSEVDDERGRLMVGDLEDQAAVAVLEQTYQLTEQRLNSAGSVAVTDDLVSLIDMLRDGTHIILGAEEAQRQDEKLREQMDKLSAEMEELTGEDDSPGFLSQVWSVVGWDSFGDFLSDAAVTILTGGVKKLYKTVKNIRKVRAASKVRKAARKARNSKLLWQLEKMGVNAGKLITAIRKRQPVIEKTLLWAKKNAPNIARRIATDLGANWGAAAVTGDVKGAPSVAVSRIAKDRIQSLVDDFLGESSEVGDKYVEALFALKVAGGNDALERQLLDAFLSHAFRRHALTNVIHAAITKTGGLNIPTDFKSLGLDVADITLTTVSEVINDFVSAIPYSDELRSYINPAIETARKFLVNVVRNALFD